MKKFKVTVWSGAINTVTVKEFKDKDAALTEFANLLQAPNFIRLDDVMLNPKNVSFVAAEEIQEPVESITVDV